MSALQAEADSRQWDDRYDLALPIHRRAELFATSLPAPIRDSRAVRMARAANLRLLGEAAHKLKQAAEARAAIDRAIALDRQLVAGDPGNPQLLRKLINALRYAAVVHRTNERDALARKAIGEAADLAARVSARDPDDTGQLHQLALVQEVQAQILGDNKDYVRSFAVGDAMLAAHRRIVQLAGNAVGARRSLSQALRTNGGNRYNGHDYAGACRHWQEARELMLQLDREGALSDSDRAGSLAEMTDFTARACGPGGPRAALGPSV